MAPHAALREASVVGIVSRAAGVTEFAIVPADGGPLAPFSAGAHILCEVELPGGERSERAYSLVNAPGDRDAYRIAVLRDEAGRGGSRFMHALEVGRPLRVSEPRNDFPLAVDASEHLLLAGGIGVTPILAMARELSATDARFAVHYVGQHRDRMSYADELEALPGANVLVDGGDPTRGLDLTALLGGWQSGRHVYVCGPRGLIEAVRSVAERAGWQDDHVHFELFAAEAAHVGDQSFEVELRQSGVRLTILPGASILDEMLAAGLDPLFDCQRGECGLCAVPVLAGVPDHRDINLSKREKESGKVICTCVSRALTPLLVLDA